MGKVTEEGVRRLDAGDGLRAVAMLSIFFVHVFLDAAPGALPNGDWDYWGPAGHVLSRLDLGLMIFFALSGYLISRPFARAFVAGRAAPDVGRFARNRALRILPVYLVCCLLALAYFGARGSSLAEVLAVFGVQYLYVGADGPLGAGFGFPLAQSWTLTTEVWFYASVPLMAAAGAVAGRRLPPGRPRVVLGLGMLAGAFLLSAWVRTRGGSEMARLNSPPGIFFAFAPGVALALAEPVLAPLAARRPQTAARVAIAAFWGSALLLATYVALEPSRYIALHHVKAAQAIAAGMGAGLLLAGFLGLQLAGRGPGPVGGRAMTWLGERSYPFYLLHFGVMVALAEAMGDDHTRAAYAVVLALAGFPITLGASVLMHRFIEKPFLERRRPVGTTTALAVSR